MESNDFGKVHLLIKRKMSNNAAVASFECGRLQAGVLQGFNNAQSHSPRRPFALSTSWQIDYERLSHGIIFLRIGLALISVVFSNGSARGNAGLSPRHDECHGIRRLTKRRGFRAFLGSLADARCWRS